MIRSALMVFVVSAMLISSLGSSALTEIRGYSKPPSLPTDFHISDKNNKEVKRKASEVLKPLIEFKNAVEPHLPQKEVRTVKRIAFQVFLIARRYL